MPDKLSSDAAAFLHEGERAFRSNLDHALRRQAEVDAKADAQAWEIEHARDAVTQATAALAVIGVALAMRTMAT